VEATSEQLENLDNQIIAYAMYYFGQDGTLHDDLDDGYPCTLYTAYGKAQKIANALPMEWKKYVIENDDLDPNVVWAEVEKILKPKEIKAYTYFQSGGYLGDIIEIVEDDGTEDGKSLTHLAAPQTVEIIEATAKSFGVTNLNLSDTDMRPEKAYREEK
jgi:hypothetical protein